MRSIQQTGTSNWERTRRYNGLAHLGIWRVAAERNGMGSRPIC